MSSHNEITTMNSAAMEPWETRNTKTVKLKRDPERDLMLSVFCFIISLPILGVITITGDLSFLFIPCALLSLLGTILLIKSMRSVGEEKIVFDNRETISTFDPEALHDRIRSIVEKEN